jgi:acyl dehydratase
LVDSGVPLAGGLIGLGGSIKWPRPARPGDVLTVYEDITEVTPSKPDRGTIGINAETRNQRGDVVQSLTATLLVPRRA